MPVPLEQKRNISLRVLNGLYATSRTDDNGMDNTIMELYAQDATFEVYVTIYIVVVNNIANMAYIYFQAQCI